MSPDEVLDKAIAKLEATEFEIKNLVLFRNAVIDECIATVGLGISRDGRNTSHYQQSQKHLADLEKLKSVLEER